jgi:hypothetical protein
MVIHKFETSSVLLGWSIPQTVLWTFGKASLVGTNSVWGSGKRQRNIQPESVNKFAKVERSLSILTRLFCILAGVVYSVKDRSIHLGKTLELNINVVTIVMIVKKLVFIVLILV